MKKRMMITWVILMICITFSSPVQTAEEFTFVFLTDTHLDYKCTQENLRKIADWIVENQEGLNIKYVAHQGDIADRRGTGNINQMMQASREALQPVMDADIPISIAIGNHDYDMTSLRSTNAFNRNTAFGIEFYEGRTWFGGTFEIEADDPGKYPGGTANHYLIQEIEGRPFLFLTLEYRARDKVMEWADDLVTNRYPDHDVLINTHDFLTRAGNLSTGRYVTEPPGPDYSNNAAELWEKYLSNWENLRIIISGHYIDDPRQAYISLQGIHGNLVHVHFWNYQNWAFTSHGYMYNTRTGGDNQAAMIKMFKINLDDNMVNIQNYLPTIGITGDPARPSFHSYLE